MRSILILMKFDFLLSCFIAYFPLAATMVHHFPLSAAPFWRLPRCRCPLRWPRASAEPVRLRPRVAGESGHSLWWAPDRTLQAGDGSWCSQTNRELGGAPAWIVYEFDPPAAVARVGVRGSVYGASPREMTLQAGAAAAGPWDDVLPFTAERRGGMQEFAVAAAPGAHRFWRVLFLTNHGQADPDEFKFIVCEVAFWGV